LRNLLPPRIASISTMTTIMIAKAMIPVVSPETGGGIRTGIGVSSISFFGWLLNMVIGMTDAAAWAELKACKVPTRKVTATNREIIMIMERG